MDEMSELTGMRGNLINRVRDVSEKGVAYSQGFLEYANLWTDDRQVVTYCNQRKAFLVLVQSSLFVMINKTNGLISFQG